MMQKLEVKDFSTHVICDGQKQFTPRGLGWIPFPYCPAPSMGLLDHDDDEDTF